MPDIYRRHFLKGLTAALGTIGLSQVNLEHRALRYGKVLAQPTRRKIALLVGVNDYTREPLAGALNDVELQQQLLIHRFGFLPQDIHTLTNEDASRQRILETYQDKNPWTGGSQRRGGLPLLRPWGQGAGISVYARVSARSGSGLHQPR
ncbi:MAG: caspase family protein [Leptolyngbya sp. SIOISBB]|nr:caspase family protein [Leptolyngbya sp. SIOISBB]